MRRVSAIDDAGTFIKADFGDPLLRSPLKLGRDLARKGSTIGARSRHPSPPVLGPLQIERRSMNVLPDLLRNIAARHTDT
jgi:hypothetical protein